jgi:hypothetical protein
VEVRRVFRKLRSASIENVNGLFKAIFDLHGAVPTKGLTSTRRFALGAVFVYQLTLWHRHAHGLDLRVGLDPLPQSRLRNCDRASPHSARRQADGRIGEIPSAA